METIGGYRLKQLENQAAKLRRRLERDTQKLRQRLLSELEAMFELAKNNIESAKAPKEKQLWVRIMGYLGQVMNSIAESFDEAKAMEYLKTLAEMAKRGQAERNSQTSGEADSGDSGAAEG